jgi:sugar-specific transcriptional regulator TrmB
MYQEVLENLGLAKNEAKIYETLVIEGESSIGRIAEKSQVHRRNVYDSIQRMVEKGLVFEIIEKKENRYQAVDPKKLSEILEEKQVALQKVLPSLERLFQTNPPTESVYIYRGLEGWKNYMRDILRVGEDDYIMGAKGVWGDEKIKSFTDRFSESAKKKGIRFQMLFDNDARERTKPVAAILGADYKLLPEGYETSSCFEVFGDHVVFIANCKGGVLREDLSLTVIINQQIADSFRTWFKLIWDMSK